jgi:hypothetical protein
MLGQQGVACCRGLHAHARDCFRCLCNQQHPCYLAESSAAAIPVVIHAASPESLRRKGCVASAAKGAASSAASASAKSCPGPRRRRSGRAPSGVRGRACAGTRAGGAAALERDSTPRG